MEIIEAVLKNIYSTSDQYRILNDPEYFIDLLVKQYRPEFKYDCKLLEKGIRCGAGNIVWQFVSKKTMPTDEDNAKFTSLLQERANLTLDEANRLIGLLINIAERMVSDALSCTSYAYRFSNVSRVSTGSYH